MTTGNYTLLPMELAHVMALQGLPAHHRDRFNRMLIAQALSENLSRASCDSDVAKYQVPLFW